MLFKSAKKGAEKTDVRYVPHNSLIGHCIGDDVTEGKCTDEDGDEPVLQHGYY